MGGMDINWTVIIAFLSFACLHSLTVSRAFKRFIARIIGETAMRAYYRLAFTAFSALITFAAFYAIITQPDVALFRPPVYVLLPARLAQAVGILIFLAALRPVNMRAFTGISQAADYLRMGRTSGDIEGIEDTGLVTSGIYGLVRHPMYLAGILVFLFEPEITLNSLELRLLATGYFVLGMLIEERRLMHDFGESYRAYRKSVPMFNIMAGISRKCFRW